MRSPYQTLAIHIGTRHVLSFLQVHVLAMTQSTLLVLMVTGQHGVNGQYVQGHENGHVLVIILLQQLMA